MSAAAGQSVLVADDQREIVRLIARLLTEMAPLRVETAANGAAALERLQHDDFDLVICDWNMESMTGLELLQAVRADERLSDVRFVMITGDSDDGRVKQALAAGVDDFIVKPFTRDTLRRKVGRILGLSAASI